MRKCGVKDQVSWGNERTSARALARAAACGLDGVRTMNIVRNAKTAGARFVLVLCAVALALGLCGCAALDVVSQFTIPSRDEVEQESVTATLDGSSLVEEGVLTVAVDTSDAPQAMTDSDGEIVGYAIDVALAIGERLGLSVKIVDAASASNALDDGTADIFIGTSTESVSSDMASTDVYLQDATALFASTSATSISSVTLESLESALIAVQDASASQDALTKAGILSTQLTYSNVNECFEALIAGEADYVACDATAGAYLARMYADVEFVATISSTSSFCITMLEANEELVEAVTDALEDIDTDGTLAAIHAIWYGDLPTSLTGLQLSGLSITDSDGDEESADSDSDSDITISGDINSLSS